MLISIIFTIFASTNRKLLIMPMAKQIDILCSESSLYSAWSIVKAKPSRKRSLWKLQWFRRSETRSLTYWYNLKAQIICEKWVFHKSLILRVLTKMRQIWMLNYLRKWRKNSKCLRHLRKMSIFAPDEIKQNRTHFSQESLYETIHSVICEIL